MCADTPAISARLSVVVANYNTKDLLRACLVSMGERLRDPQYDIMVVDNASADGSVEMLRSEFPGVRVFALENNRGFSTANNIALREARGRYCMILNSDTEIVAGALERMCDYMDANPEVGVLGPQLLNTDGSIQLSCRRFPSYRTALFHRYSLLTRLFPRNRYSAQYLMTDAGHSRTMDVDWVSGACLLARREALDRAGLLDEGFFMYAEDVDWCYRIKQAGWRVVYLPDAQVRHHIGCSTRSLPFRMTYARHRSMWRFYRKHYSKGLLIVDLATWLGIATRCGITVIRQALVALARKERRP